MTRNLDRFKKDIDRLVEQGEMLRYSMYREVHGDKKFRDQLTEAWKDKKNIDAFIEKLPNFKTNYEAWYSECLALLRQVLPDRVGNFISFYEKPKSRKEIEYGVYVIQDYMQNLKVTDPFGRVQVDTAAAIPQFEQQLSILKASKTRFESALFEIRQLVQADLLDSELDAANELLKHKFYRAAGAIAGVVIEKHLRQVCDDRSITIAKKHPTISDLSEILKSNSVIDIPQWRHISLLADLRNLCDHNKNVEPTAEQIKDLIDGTNKILKTIF